MSSGGFNVHNTQAAEAFHKICMKLAVARVRHSHANKTQESMLQYLQYNLLFDTISQERLQGKPKRKYGSRTRTCSVRLPLKVNFGPNFLDAAVQRRFLHPEARVAVVELLDLLCDKFVIPRTRASYTILQNLDYGFGQKLIVDGNIFWATDTKYTYETKARSHKRREILFFKEVENVTTGRFTTNALCCEAVCTLR